MVSIPGLPTPTSLPISLCAPTGTNVHCINAENAVLGDTKDCQSAPGGETPPLASTTITWEKKSITFDGLEVQVSQSFWVGVEFDASAIWIGEPVSEQCAKINIDPPSPSATVAELEDELSHIYDDVASTGEGYGGPSRHTTGGEILYGIIFIVVIILLDLALPPYPI